MRINSRNRITRIHSPRRVFYPFFTDIFNETNEKKTMTSTTGDRPSEVESFFFHRLYLYLSPTLMNLWLTLCLFFVLAVVFLSVFRWSFLFHVFSWHVHKY